MGLAVPAGQRPVALPVRSSSSGHEGQVDAVSGGGLADLEGVEIYRPRYPIVCEDCDEPPASNDETDLTTGEPANFEALFGEDVLEAPAPAEPSGAQVAASNGDRYRYPFALRLIR